MFRRRAAARLVTVLAGLVVASGLVTVGAPSPAAALDSPSSLAADGATIPVLSWARVPGATLYDVQVSRVADFGSTLVNLSTVNNRFVPQVQMPTGDVWWRVRAKSGSTTSEWTGSSFTRTTASAPEQVQPLADATFTPPQTPRFTWQPVPGATSYTVQTGTDPAFTDPALYVENVQKTTAAYLTGYPTVGTYYWRVRAELSTGYHTAWSPATRYVVDGLAPVVRTAPDDVFDKDDARDVFVTDVVLDWEPRIGAATYELRVDTDRNFLTVDHPATGITGTRYSPPATLPNDDFYWQVRPVNANGQAAPWPDTAWRFTRAWPDQPRPVYPIGAPAANVPLFYEWEPIERASKYVVHVTDGDQYNCIAPATIHTTLAGACVPEEAGTYSWRVQGVDDGSGVPTVARPQDVVSFDYEPPAEPDPTTGPLPAVTGHAAALSGVAAHGLGVPQERCVEAVPDGQCDDLRQTPLLTWDAVPGATGYKVVLSNDAEGTNIHSTFDVVEPMWTPITSLADSQAGSAYYWKVLPCRASQCWNNSGFSHAFAKESVAPVPLSPVGSVEVANDVTLTWGSLLSRMDDPDVLASSDLATPADTDARQYLVQTAVVENFASVLESRTVDQTTFTSSSTTYPEGPIYWRVAALDGSGKQTVWSETQRFVKRSPKPVLLTPIADAPLGQDYSLSWEPLAFAKSYDVEVYSGPTRVATANTVHASWAPSDPFPASATSYTWRVRRLDAAGRPGEWTDLRSFRFEGFAPSLAAPAAGAVVPPSGTLFSWQPDARATSYRFERRKPGSTTDVAETVDTRATAWAPTSALAAGTAAWRVTALDAKNTPLGSSPWREFVVVDPPAEVTPVSITGSGKVGTDLRAYAPTFDPAVDSVTYQWYRGTSSISGATGEVYTVISTDKDKAITVRATGLLAGYKNATSTSNEIMGVLGDAPEATTPPAITGVAKFGELLTATPGTWPGGPTFKYQWYRDGTAISSATSSTYRLAAADVGRSIHVVETATVSGRAPGSATSDPVTPEAGDAPEATTPPRITQSPPVKVGDTLTLSNGTWSSSGTYSYGYQWYRDGVPITGATASTYRPVADDADRAIHAVVTATVVGRTSGTAATDPIVPNGAVVATSPPTVSGDAIAGRTVTADPGAWSSATTPTFRYQWFVNGTSVTSSSSSSNYTLKAADIGRGLHVVVTGTVTGYLPGTASSDPVTITSEGRLAPSSAPTVTGSRRVGSTLTATTGTWPESPQFTYQWFRNGARISGATRSTYTVQAADAARRLHVVVSASETNYDPGTAASTSVLIAKAASTTTLSLSRARATARQAVVVTARVASGFSAPGGTVTFYDGSRRLKVVRLTRNSAALRLPRLRVGRHTIKAVYSGGTQVAGSTRAATLTITR